MDITPAWRAPHRFQRLARIGGTLVPTEYVTTWGIACTELIDQDDLTSERLLERIGLPWIASLTDGELARRLKDDLWIGGPTQPESRRFLGEERGALAVGALELFATTEAASAVEWLNHVAYLVREINLAADERRRPSSSKTVTTTPTDGGGEPFERSLLDEARDLLDLYAPRFTPYRLTSGSWAIPPSDLRERLALELFQLYALRPVLRRCILCDAVYAPIGREANCSWRLFDTPALADDPTRPALRQCVDDERWEAWHAAEREKTYDRKRRALNEKIRRLRLSHGEQHPLTKRAEEEKNEWVKLHGPRRGPRPSLNSTGGEIASATTEGADNG